MQVYILHNYAYIKFYKMDNQINDYRWYWGRVWKGGKKGLQRGKRQEARPNLWTHEDVILIVVTLLRGYTFVKTCKIINFNMFSFYTNYFLTKP